jgi:hypothetical protein
VGVQGDLEGDFAALQARAARAKLVKRVVLGVVALAVIGLSIVAYVATRPPAVPDVTIQAYESSKSSETITIAVKARHRTGPCSKVVATARGRSAKRELNIFDDPLDVEIPAHTLPSGKQRVTVDVECTVADGVHRGSRIVDVERAVIAPAMKVVSSPGAKDAARAYGCGGVFCSGGEHDSTRVVLTTDMKLLLTVEAPRGCTVEVDGQSAPIPLEGPNRVSFGVEARSRALDLDLPDVLPSWGAAMKLAARVGCEGGALDGQIELSNDVAIGLMRALFEEAEKRPVKLGDNDERPPGFPRSMLIFGWRPTYASYRGAKGKARDVDLVAYVTTTTRAGGRCGPYGVNDYAEVTHTDTVLTIYDRRAGRVHRKGVIPATGAPCPDRLLWESKRGGLGPLNYTADEARVEASMTASLRN